MTLSDRARFARQVLVPEIGAAGQARLSATSFDVSALAPEAASVAHLYLERAGLRPLELAPPPRGASQGPAQDALAGARFAVRTIRRALDEP